MAVFLQAEWRKLAFANYVIAPEILSNYVPAGTELDVWENTCYVSLVGFKFCNTRVKGFRIPFHTDFEEVNLRFYVRFREGNSWKRGVVFIKEIVPKPAINFVANTVFKENYCTLPMAHSWRQTAKELEVEYRWKSGNWNSFKVLADAVSNPIIPNSPEEFITEHYWGYAKAGIGKTSEYEVEHPKWEIYPVKEHAIAVDFGKVYGAPFGFLSKAKPASVFLAEGSEIVVRSGKLLR